MEQHIRNTKEYNVQDYVDKILEQHMQRLLGAGQGIAALPMTSTVISCLMMLMERESEIDCSGLESFQRYTEETLISELGRLGFNLDQKVEKVPQQMIQKGYIHVDDDGCFAPEKPSKSMARLLDQVFPKMPGMNFVAYLVQTIDEINSGRKDMDSAVSQLDQMLHMQGVPLKKEQLQPGPVGTSPLQTELKDNTQTPWESERKQSVILDRNKIDRSPSQSGKSSSQSKILSYAELKNKFTIREVHFGSSSSTKEELKETISDPLTELSSEQKVGGKIYGIGLDSFLQMAQLEETTGTLTVKTDDDIGYLFLLDGELMAAETGDLKNSEAFYSIISWENVAIEIENVCHKTVNEINQPLMNLLMEGLRIKDEKTETEQQDPTTENLIKDHVPQPTEEMKDDLFHFDEAVGTALPEPEIDPEISSEPEVFDSTDADIEKRISAFEEDLSLQCPMCKHSKIKNETTKMGKSYYKCISKICSFISWGKPYHIPCPTCNNPFLVEASGKDGKLFLKCPRATCRYRQSLPREAACNDTSDRYSVDDGNKKVAAASRKPRRKVVKRRRVRRKK